MIWKTAGENKGEEVEGFPLDEKAIALRAEGACSGWARMRLRVPLAAFLGISLALFAALSLPAQPAYAKGELTTYRQLASVSEIEQLTSEYEKAYEAADDSSQETTLVRAKAGKVNEQLAEQRQRVDEAVGRLFLIQNNSYDLVEMLLNSDSLGDFIKMNEYLDAITRKSQKEAAETAKICAELESQKAELESKQEKAKIRLYKAEKALRAAQDSRAGRQQEGIWTALLEDPSAGGVEDGADWYATEREFVAEWAPRIDAYLAGSPMAGLGATFAKASWRYCVDPRWSPAIANTESSKGRLCVRPYNAWGWGAADEDPTGLALEWDSWETAIDAHVRGLSAGYGYTISLGNAQKYCTSWEHWYPDTLAEMASI